MDQLQRAEAFMGGADPAQTPGWPPRYSGGQLQPGSASFPPSTWPSAAQLDYTTKLITAALLVLALPAIVALLLTRPGALFAGLGAKHLG